MSAIVTGQNENVLWRDLVQEAEEHSKTKLTRAVEEHLLSALIYHTSESDILARALGEDFLKIGEGVKMGRLLAANAYERLGDTCLIVAGLFPERARSKRVNLSYFVWLTHSCYASAMYITRDERRGWFQVLGENVEPMLAVLWAIRNHGRDRASKVIRNARLCARLVEPALVIPIVYRKWTPKTGA